MHHTQLTIQANQFQQEELIALLNDFNPSGYEQTDEHLIAFFDSEEFDQQEIQHIVEGYDYQVELVEARNWNEEWERNFQPVVVDHFCAIRADFHEPIRETTHEIIITPKMSFGTGHHATTYMMIDHMRDIDFKGKAVFDFGTGTGILAILAEKLGAASVYAIDVDEWSIDNAQENFQRNGCSRIELKLSSQVPERQQFEIILANINRNVLLQNADSLKKASKENGQLLLSGLLAEDEQDIVAAFEQKNLRLVKQKQRDKWISLLFVNDK